MTNGENQSRSEIKRARAPYAIRKKKVRKVIRSLGAVIVAGLLIGWFVWNASNRSQNLPGKFIPDQGRQHVGPGHGHTYNSNPPTSGPHFAQPAEWGIYKEEIPDEVLVHNLEHGGIWISYKPGIPEDVIVKLESFREKYGRKIIVAPRSANDTDIALAAWTRLDKFSVSEYSDERVEEFIKAYRNKGPEFVP